MSSGSDAERAEELKTVAENDPESVPLDELDSLLESDADAVLHPTLRTLMTIGRETPEDLRPRRDLVRECLGGVAVETRVLAVRLLGKIALTYPEDRQTVLNDLVELLSTETARVDEVTILTPDEEMPRDSFAVLPPLLDVLKMIEDEHPGSTVRTVDSLGTLLDARSDAVQLATLELLVVLSLEEPAAIQPVGANLREYVERGPTREEVNDEEFRAFLGRAESVSWSDVHAAATKALCNLSREYPEEAQPVVDELAPLLDTSDRSLRYAVIVGLDSVAKEAPGQVSHLADPIAGCLDDSGSFGRSLAVGTLAAIAQADSEEVVPFIDDIRQLLDHPDSNVRNNATWALNVLADQDPDAVRPGLPEIASFVTDDRALTRENALSCLRRIALAYPDAVRPYHSAIENRLTDDSFDVRRVAAKAMFPIGVERARYMNRYIGWQDS